MESRPAVEALPDGTFRTRLWDGRWLAWSERGPAGAPTWLWIPGTPSSRFSGPPDEAVRAANIRIVVLERPGYGISDPRPGRAVTCVVRDVATVADRIGVDRLSLIGISGAGPYLAACAHLLRDRVNRVVFGSVVGPPDEPGASVGLAPFNRASLALASRAPAAAALVARFTMGDPARLLHTMTRNASPPDRAVLSRIGGDHLHSTREALRQGTDTFAWELHLAARPWGVPLREISVPVDVWHGEQDRTTPVAMGRALAAAIPRARLRVVPTEGHFVAYTRLAEMVAPPPAG